MKALGGQGAMVWGGNLANLAGRRTRVVNYRSSAYLSVLILFCLCSMSFADLTDPTLVFKMTADKTVLSPGEETTVHVWAWIYTPAGIEKPHNGLDTWQLDLSVDNTDVIQIVGINLLAPDPDPVWSGWDHASLNNPVTGEVREVVVSQQIVGAPSDIGVGIDDNIDNHANYSEIFNLTIRAQTVPFAQMATYTLMDDGGGLFYGAIADGTEFENDSPSAFGGVDFYGAGSDNVFTVVPEPGTFVLLATAAAFAIRRRR
jgi:hypothetical protein